MTVLCCYSWHFCLEHFANGKAALVDSNDFSNDFIFIFTFSSQSDETIETKEETHLEFEQILNLVFTTLGQRL
jgi:hypothetical protein